MALKGESMKKIELRQRLIARLAEYLHSLSDKQVEENSYIISRCSHDIIHTIYRSTKAFFADASGDEISCSFGCKEKL